MSNTSSIRPWLGLIGLSLMASIAFLDFTIVYTALPAIQKALAVPVINLQWIMNIFALILAILMILSGKLADIFGKRKVFYLGVLIFGIAALGAGTRNAFAGLVFFRGLQAVGAAIIFTTAAALAPSGFAKDKQARAIGIYSAITGFGLAIGPFVGGVLVSALSWRWIFFVNIPLILIGFLLCLGNVKETSKEPGEKIDWVGVLLMAIGFGSLIYSIINAGNHGWADSVTIIGFVVAIIALTALWQIEKRISNPLFDIDDISNTKVLLGIHICGSASIMTSGMLFIIPLYLSNILNVTPMQLGLLLLSPPLTQILTSFFWGKLSAKYGINKLLMLGIVTAFLSALMQLFFGLDTQFVLVVIALLLMGFIWGVANAGTITLALDAVPIERTGSVIGLIFTNWNVTGSILLALASTIFTAVETGYMKAELMGHGIKLTVSEHHTVAAMLGNPSRAQELLSQLVGPLVDKISPLFKLAFLRGYHSIMLFSVILFILAFSILLLLIRRGAREEQSA